MVIQMSKISTVVATWLRLLADRIDNNDKDYICVNDHRNAFDKEESNDPNDVTTEYLNDR